MKNKKYKPLLAGIIISIPVYIIDAVIWWNLPTTNPSSGTGFVREYNINGIQMTHPLGEYFWLKFGADFMMTISYSLFAFTWLWIMFDSWKTKDFKEMTKYTTIWFSFWILVPILSFLIPWDDRLVYCIRHMDSQIIAQILSVIFGYVLLLLLYGTDRFNSIKPKTILFVFIAGCLQAFIMEFPLFITGIRPISLTVLIYETIILTNQGAPYLYIIYDKIIPKFKPIKEIQTR
jgi:hypothetical protein